MFLRRFVNDRGLLRGLRPASNLLARTGAVRTYSAGQKRAPKKDDLPSFTKIALVGVVGTIIFVEAVKSLDKNKPKNSYSESEFESAMQGTKRRKLMFEPGQLHIVLATPDLPETAVQKHTPKAKIVDVREVVEHYRHQPNDKYYALLNDIQDSHGSSYQEYLPRGLLVMLVGRYLQETCKEGDSVAVTNFPLNMQDAIKFENEVGIVDKALFTSPHADSELSKYYQTVNKVEVLE
ncbi:LAFA_0G09560g1_1 [Lachancea sp. 'fantastica']|nr:LAFA_0G09560g1_1 [Lachancea sp. 'fantastica']